MEISALRVRATTLLDVYVGAHSGKEILQGKVLRGDVQRIRAVIWMSDLRGFTQLSNREEGKAVIESLNQHFDCLVNAIESEGGEVLKFLGDGLLAFFPVPDAAFIASVCRRTMRAATAARTASEALNRERETAGHPPLGYVVALHYGDILYGNIGGGNRSDFTAIGAGVNLTARLLGVAAEQGKDIVASAAFAEACPIAFEPFGHFPLKGFAEPQPTFVEAT